MTHISDLASFATPLYIMLYTFFIMGRPRFYSFEVSTCTVGLIENFYATDFLIEECDMLKSVSLFEPVSYARFDSVKILNYNCYG